MKSCPFIFYVHMKIETTATATKERAYPIRKSNGEVHRDTALYGRMKLKLFFDDLTRNCFVFPVSQIRQSKRVLDKNSIGPDTDRHER